MKHWSDCEQITIDGTPDDVRAQLCWYAEMGYQIAPGQTRREPGSNGKPWVTCVLYLPEKRDEA